MSHSLIRAGYVDSITVDGIVRTMDQTINYVILRVCTSFICDQESHVLCGVLRIVFTELAALELGTLCVARIMKID